MGLLDLIKQETRIHVDSMLPPLAQDEIMNGRLPILRTSLIFLKSGELCHYMDNAIYEKERVKRHTVRRTGGVSIPGLFKGTRVYLGNGGSDSYEEKAYEQIRGKIFITNRRVIFVGSSEGFDEPLNELVAVTPYSNCIELQFSKNRYRIFIPNGNIAYNTLQIINR